MILTLRQPPTARPTSGMAEKRFTKNYRLGAQLKTKAGRKSIDQWLRKCADKLVALRSALFLYNPSEELYPWRSNETETIAKAFNSMADWLNRARSLKGRSVEWDAQWRVLILCKIFKAFSGKPLYEYATRLVSRAFPHLGCPTDKRGSSNLVKRALRRLSIDEIEPIHLPDELKAWKSVKRRQSNRRPK